jgi:DHA1 family multidrug resistance protein-like MFS transporter
LGFFYGGIIPTANTIISLSTPSQDRGKVFGIANSTTFLGNIFGPIAGGFIITTFNLTAVFVFTGGILLLAGLALPAIIKKSEKITTAE